MDDSESSERAPGATEGFRSGQCPSDSFSNQVAHFSFFALNLLNIIAFPLSPIWSTQLTAEPKTTHAGFLRTAFLMARPETR